MTAATLLKASFTATPRLSSSSSTPLSLAETLALEGLEHVNICQPNDIVQVLEAINLQSDKLIAGVSNQQYLVFSSVTQDDLTKIDDQRGKHTRATYYKDVNLLIIKLMPSVKHEAAHGNFGQMIVAKTIMMGMSIHSLYSTGATRFEGSSSSKEADTSFKPQSRVNETDWPTIVIEAGLSESLAKLRSDANWWLVNSGGDVMIVVIISITPRKKSLRIEKWENVAPAPGRPITRANPSGPIPRSVQDITIRPNVTGAITPYRVIGAPLVLHFHKIFLRLPIPPETDFTFSTNELAEFARTFWECAQ